MKRVTIQATPLLVEIERIPAHSKIESFDALRLKVTRGDCDVMSVDVYRGEGLECDDGISSEEQTQISALLVAEWLSWPDTTAKELPPSKTILELYEDLAKLVNAKNGAAA